MTIDKNILRVGDMNAKTTHIGFEEIEKLPSMPDINFFVNAKINELIEKVNLIMQLLNEEVGRK
jgi:hypothetical protein